MKTRVIRLEAIQSDVPLGAYVHAVRAAIASPEATFKHGLTTWWPTSGAEIRAQFRAGVHDRINRGMRRGRKWSADYQRALRQDASDVRRIVQERVRIYSLRTPDIRRRCVHLLASMED